VPKALEAHPTAESRHPVFACYVGKEVDTVGQRLELFRQDLMSAKKDMANGQLPEQPKFGEWQQQAEGVLKDLPGSLGMIPGSDERLSVSVDDAQSLNDMCELFKESIRQAYENNGTAEWHDALSQVTSLRELVDTMFVSEAPGATGPSEASSQPLASDVPATSAASGASDSEASEEPGRKRRRKGRRVVGKELSTKGSSTRGSST
jgi:hypothetical protein